MSFLLYSFLCVFCLQVYAGDTCTAVDQCTCRTEDGKYISLWDVDRRFTVKDTLDRGFTYSYRPCSILSNVGAACDGNLACQTYGSASFAIAYKPQLVKTAYDFSLSLYTFTYTGSTDKPSGTVRKTIIQLKCDPKATVPALDTFFEQPNFVYTSTLTSKCACPGGCKRKTPAPTPSKEKSGLSTGSVLCIILLVLVIVYFFGGILICKYALHKENADVIPHREFWKDLPVLIKDGFVFTYGKLKRKNGSYQELS